MYYMLGVQHPHEFNESDLRISVRYIYIYNLFYVYYIDIYAYIRIQYICII